MTSRLGVLAALALSLGATAPPASAQTGAVRLDALVAMARGGRTASEIESTLRSSCIAFPVDSVAIARLRAAGLDASVVERLEELCYLGSTLGVTTEPSGVVVRLDGRPAGLTPVVRPIASPARVLVEVAAGGRARQHTVNVPAGRSVTVHFDVPRDTQPLPPAPAAEEAERLREVLRRGEPSTPPPDPPVPPRRRNGVKAWLLGGLAGAVVGGAVGVGLCSDELVRYRFDPALGYAVPDGTERRIAGGCAAAAAGIGLASGGLLVDVISRRRYSRRLRAYERASVAFALDLARWEADSRANRERLLPGIEEQIRRAEERDRIARENERIRERNRALPDPIVQVHAPERLPRAGTNR